MNLKHILVMLVTFNTVAVFSQSDFKKNTVDVTLGGSGLIASVNYSRIISVQDTYLVNSSIGLGVVSSGVSIPHQVTFNFGKNTSFFEAGLGGTFWTGVNSSTPQIEANTSYSLSPIVGWRKHLKQNLVFRIYASPLFHISGETFYENHKVLPFGGISLGYRF